MSNKSWIVRLLLLALVLMSLVAAPLALAQEGGEGGEAAAEEVAAEGGEAAAAEEGGSPLTPLGINVGFLLAQIVNFLLIFLLLRFLLWNPLRNMLDSRAAKIQKGLEDASAAANARRNAEVEAEKILSAARADAAREVESARARGEDVAKQVIAEANQEAERIRSEARARGEEERNKQLADMRSQVVNISMAVAQRVVGETLDAKKQSALISDFFARVPDGAKKLAGGSVEVVSAMPLSDDEKTKIAKELGVEDVTYSVDPNILGGLVIRSADRVVDGSVRSSLSELGSRLR
jgi:F-type H+-transporting ATPase subunit b